MRDEGCGKAAKQCKGPVQAPQLSETHRLLRNALGEKRLFSVSAEKSCLVHPDRLQVDRISSTMRYKIKVQLKKARAGLFLKR